MKTLAILFVSLIASAAAAQEARPKVLATLPTLGAIVREVAGDTLEVIDLSRGNEDPHFVSATPLLMRRARDADALFEVGMRLDTWVDNVANGAGNPKINRGAAGRVVLSDGIPPLEVPTRIDAAQGDIHPQGNPHIWLDPVRAKLIARNVERALVKLFPAHAETYATRRADFERRVDEALYGPKLIELVSVKRLDRAALRGRLHTLLDRKFKGEPLRSRAGGWLRRASSLRGIQVVEYHKVWVYFAQTFGLELVGVIEQYPGVRPGPGHIRRTIELIESKHVPLILVDNFYERDLPTHIATQSGATMVVLPNQVGGEDDAVDYFSLIDAVLDRMLKGVAK